MFMDQTSDQINFGDVFLLLWYDMLREIKKSIKDPFAGPMKCFLLDFILFVDTCKHYIDGSWDCIILIRSIYCVFYNTTYS